MLTIERMEFMQLDWRIYYRTQFGDPHTNDHHKCCLGIWFFFQKFVSSILLRWPWGRMYCYGWNKTNKCITSSPSKNVDVGKKIGDLLDIQSGGAQAVCASLLASF